MMTPRQMMKKCERNTQVLIKLENERKRLIGEVLISSYDVADVESSDHDTSLETTQIIVTTAK